MTPQDVETARRAVACKGWRWMPGMRVWWPGPGRYTRLREQLDELDEAVLDVTDPPTLGYLLAMVREAWADPFLSVQGKRNIGWRIVGGKQHGSTFNRMCEVWHDFEASALVAALEAAP